MSESSDAKPSPMWKKKEKRTKLDYKTEKCIYLGMSPRHSADTHKLLSLNTNQVIYHRNVSFNERSFPARTAPITRTVPSKNDTGEDLIGQTFKEDNETFIITECSRHDGLDCLDYISSRTKEDFVSTVPEVRKWVKQTSMLQMANNIQPSRKGYMNTLAETMSQQINPRPYQTKLSSNTIKPPKSYKGRRTRKRDTMVRSFPKGERWITQVSHLETTGSIQSNSYHASTCITRTFHL